MKERFTDYNPRASTLAVIEYADALLNQYAAQGYVLSVRQLYYQFVSRDLIPNRQSEYNRLARIISEARKGGMIDWDAIEDRGRNLTKLATWASPQDRVEAAARTYRRDRWADQPEAVEIWVEKDALLGVIRRAVQGLDVPYMSCRGYPSSSMVYEASKRFEGCTVLHLGDHDPSGIDATRSIEAELELYGAMAEVRRIALTWDQVVQYAPPPNPAKDTDSRYEGYVKQHGTTDCWELDALEPQVIVDLIQAEVETMLDREIWDETLAREERERDQIRKAAATLS